MRYCTFLWILACEEKASQSISDNVIAADVGEQIQGDLSEGEILSDLDWAQRGSVACWPGNEHINFMGHHVFYSVTQDPHTLLTATVNPEQSDLDVNVYILQQALGSNQVPPNVDSVVTCEAGFPQATDSNPGEEDSASVTAIDNGYFNIIGVAGPKDVVAGGFTLSIHSEEY
ncbi:MAG: hypothetical protein VX278_00955 [Myxococcota bacterium]|nr:hypothetical protein [Myxococcota bacterium]